MKIYTKKGDDGTSGFLFGGRGRKNDVRFHACGSVDETVAALGLARSFKPQAQGLEATIDRIQRGLFVAGSELSAQAENFEKLTPGVSRVSPEMVGELEREIDQIVALCPLPDKFILPGSCEVSAALDIARGAVRRTERYAVEALVDDPNDHVPLVAYLNRVSDLLFTAARLEEDSRGLTPSLVN